MCLVLVVLIIVLPEGFSEDTRAKQIIIFQSSSLLIRF